MSFLNFQISNHANALCIYFFKSFIKFVTILLFLLNFLVLFVLLCLAWGIWDLSSPSRDRTHTPGIGRRGLNPLDCHGSPCTVSLNKIKVMITEPRILDGKIKTPSFPS